MPNWGGDMSEIYFDDIYYYIKPTDHQVDAWDELPDSVKDTYEKLGIPEAERKYLAGVTAQYESEVVYHRNREDLEAQGVIFTDMDTALREHPEIVEAYFGTVIPKNDNKFAALNSSVWSGGSFIYVPPGVNVEMPLQAYFRINAENMGQFERTLIIADEGSQVHYIEGCSAPVYTTDSLHSAVVEIIVKPSARVTYTTIQNWSNNVFNLVTKRARVETEGHMEWIDGNIGSRLTMKYPAVYMVGPKASGEVLSVAYAGPGQHQDAGAKMVHAAPETTSKIVSKSISKDGGRTSYRGLVRVEDDAYGCKSHVQCDALILDDESVSRHLPLHGGRRPRRHRRPRGHRVQGGRRAALLPDEPRPVRGAGHGHGGQRLHRAGDPHPADGVRGRVEPPDRAADGGLGRLTGLPASDLAACAACPCARNASTSRAAPTPTVRRRASASSTWRPRRRGAARRTARRYERRLADVNWQHGDLIEPALEDEPEGEGIAELLDEAEDIVNAAGPAIVAEVEAQDRHPSGAVAPRQGLVPPQALSSVCRGPRRRLQCAAVDVSCAFATSPDTPEHIRVAEVLGYRRAWAYDTPAICTDVWIALALAAERTSEIGLGPAVLVPSLRHPMTNATAIATLCDHGAGPGRRRDRVGLHRPLHPRTASTALGRRRGLRAGGAGAVAG